MLLMVTRRVTFRSRGMGDGESWSREVGSQEVERRSSRAAEKPRRFSPPDLPPFLSKLLGKTSKLQIFPSKLRVFPSKLRRNGPKYSLILRRLQRQKNSLFLTARSSKPTTRSPRRFAAQNYFFAQDVKKSSENLVGSKNYSYLCTRKAADHNC